MPASRSAGESFSERRSSSELASDGGPRLAFGDAPVAYLGQSEKDVTAGGGSCVIAPAVTPTETKNNSSNRCASSPAMLGTTRFARVTPNCYGK
ncbi:hypothetical protein [Natronocalculus amylovorans]|uniref:Uncharacterized protein n=1 Tax=Natronocalculus amylovorans TaxID=2917812 RepID=A0AAE3K6K1_9EURY|nr:hypothetical protein [Natronocalculus amylovorans]MCL9815322.1 hypothetical protein [Natronocalculus amylovorans]